MVQSAIALNWVYEHYLYYLCLCIADSDCIVSDKDEKKIQCEVFKSVNPIRVKYLQQEVYREFLMHSETQKMEFISQNAPRFLRTPVIRQKVITQLEQFSGKEDENNPAWVMFRFIRRVINNLK